MAQNPDSGASPLRRRPRAAAVAPEPDPEPDHEAVSTPPQWRRGMSTRHLWTLVAVAIVAGTIAGVIAGVATANAAPKYQSQALLNIDQPRAVALSADDGVVAKLSRLRYKYAGLVRSETFAKPIAAELHLPVATVLGSLTTTVDPATLIMGVGSRSGDADMSQRIATAAAQRLVEFTRAQQNADKIPAAAQVKFTIVTPALPAVKVAPSKGRDVLVAVGAFVFVAGGVLGFGYLWRREQ